MPAQPLMLAITPRFFPALALLVAVKAAPAQTYAVDRGVWQPGGGLGLSYSRVSETGSATTSLSVSPDLGYFISPGVAVRGFGYFGYTNFSSGHSFSYGFGPGLTYYFRHGPHVLYPYISVGASRSATKLYDPGASDARSTSRAWNWSLGAGAVRLLTHSFGIYGEVYYAGSYVTSDQSIFNPAGPHQVHRDRHRHASRPRHGIRVLRLLRQTRPA